MEDNYITRSWAVIDSIEEENANEERRDYLVRNHKKVGWCGNPPSWWDAAVLRYKLENRSSFILCSEDTRFYEDENLRALVLSYRDKVSWFYEEPDWFLLSFLPFASDDF